MPKVLLDQGLPLSSVQSLRQHHWDVVHVSDVGMSRATDREIIEYALKTGRVCITLDADFHAILAINAMAKPSIVRIRQEGLKGSDVAVLLIQVWRQAVTQLDAGALVTVTEDAIRIRTLPL